jgi:chorismate--pyruvate lyase
VGSFFSLTQPPINPAQRHSSDPIHSGSWPQGSQSDWLRLDPLWHCEDLQIPHQRLSPAWQLLVLGDGYTTRNLTLVCGQSIQAHVLESIPVDPDVEKAPAHLDPLGEAIQRRQVWLGPDRMPLLYATSWWEQTQIQSTLKDPNLPIGTTLMGAGAEVSRRILGVWWGHCPELERLFGTEGPFWGRHYWLIRHQRPLTLIYEVFSSRLSQWIGDPGG